MGRGACGRRVLALLAVCAVACGLAATPALAVESSGGRGGSAIAIQTAEAEDADSAPEDEGAARTPSDRMASDVAAADEPAGSEAPAQMGATDERARIEAGDKSDTAPKGSDANIAEADTAASVDAGSAEEADGDPAPADPAPADPAPADPAPAGWVREDGTWRYFVDGAATTGWLDWQGHRYHLDEATGAMDTGWIVADGTRHYLYASGVLAQSDWVATVDGRLLVDASGAPGNGWVAANGEAYRVADGQAQTGLLTIHGNLYYTDATGMLCHDCRVVVDGRRYSLSAEGVATDVTEPLAKEGGHWVYRCKDGTVYGESDTDFHAGTVEVPPGMSAEQASVVRATNNVPSPGAGLCSEWVTAVFEQAGIGSWGGDACDQYREWCHSTDPFDLQVGMIVAVPTEPHSPLAVKYGHVGVYVGNGLVMQNVSGKIRYQTLPGWISYFGETAIVKWGWLGGRALA